MKAFLLICFSVSAFALQLPAQDAPNLDPSTKKVTTTKKWKDANGQERSMTIIKEANDGTENEK